MILSGQLDVAVWWHLDVLGEEPLHLPVDLVSDRTNVLQQLTFEAVQVADVVITMGCGDTCDLSGKRATR